MPATLPLIIIAAIAALLIFRRSSFFSPNAQKNYAKPTPVEPKQNDKLIEIKNAAYADIEKSVLHFCAKYAIDATTVTLNETSSSTILMSFPYDFDFNNFCFLINYLYYPEDIVHHAGIKAWTTLPANNSCVATEHIGKKAMFYIPADDKEYDNVLMTTNDNKAYKISFARRKPIVLHPGTFTLYQPHN